MTGTSELNDLCSKSSTCEMNSCLFLQLTLHHATAYHLLLLQLLQYRQPLLAAAKSRHVVGLRASQLTFALKSLQHKLADLGKEAA